MGAGGGWIAGCLIGCFACVLVLAAPAAAWGAEAVARIAYLRGGGSAQVPGDAARALAESLPLHVNDRISTARDSAVRIEFNDKSEVWLGAEAVFVIDRFRTEGEDPAFLVSVAKGAFRIISGLIARSRPRAVTVNIAPVSTIGIRGTHFGGEVRETSSTVVLLVPVGEGGPSAIEVSNAFGAVVIDEPGFGTDIPDEFSPPSPPRRMQLRAVENLVRTLQTIQRVQPPRLPR